MDAALIDAIRNGTQEVSCGYAADTEMISGKYNGEDYDAIQRNIRYNHLAVVPRGRAGPEVRIRLDAAEEIEPTSREKRMTVARVKLGRSNVECELPIEAAALVRDAFKQDMMTMEELEAKVMELEKQVAELAGAKAGLEVQLDEKNLELDMEKDEEKNEEKMDSLINARIALRNTASKILEAGKFDLTKMKALDIKKACISAKMPSLKLDGLKEDFINGCFETIALTASTPEFKADTTTTGTRNDGMFDSTSARKAAMERDANAWKRK